MSILCCVFLFIINWNTNCYKWKNAFLQRTSTKTILTKEENLTELQASERVKNAHFGNGKMRNGEKGAERFFRAIFSRVKICKFSFLYYKIEDNRNDCAVLQMYTFFGRCTFVMRISWAGCLMYWSEAVRSVPGATSEARRERTTVYRSEQAVIGLSPMLIF